MKDAAWLPNLVGGTSIWKLAGDLNETKYFDGRLLVPETDGSESLPVTVRWDLTGLISLAEARAKYPEEVAAAVRDFESCLERVADMFSMADAGFHKYKETFTLPSLEAESGGNYFYSASKKKLFVINWGAFPRSMDGDAEYVFGYEDWDNRWNPAPAETDATPPAASPKPAALETVERRRVTSLADQKARTWWTWPLFALVAIALGLVVVFFVEACQEPKLTPAADGAAAPLTSASSSDGGGTDTAAFADNDGNERSADHLTADGPDAGVDGASTGDAKDGGNDSSLATDDDEDDSNGSASTNGEQKTSVHRSHSNEEATHWRVAAGMQKVSRTEQRGHRFDVWLAPGESFEGVRVEWQDDRGTWHAH